MITAIEGTVIERKEQSVVLDVHGLFYEVMVPGSVLQRLDGVTDVAGKVRLVTYYYFQMSPSSGIPTLIGFLNALERDFFLHFIKVSGIGPRAAVKALNKPIAEITQAIESGDVSYLKTLPGIGLQRSKEIVAKLQGKIARFGLIQDRPKTPAVKGAFSDWQQEALSVLLQLQYKKNEAEDMLTRALERNATIATAEELLNEIYKQKVTG